MMNKRIKYLILFFVTLMMSASAISQTNGDYRSRQSGNFNVAATWEKFQGGTWISPSPDAPTANNIRTRITIRNGHTVTAVANFRSQSLSAALTIDQGGTLNMSAFSVKSTSNLGNIFPAITINGTLTTSSYVSARTLTIGSAGIFRSAYPGTNGWWQNTYQPVTISLNGTVELNGTNQKVPSYTYNNIYVSGSGTKTLAGNITVNGSLLINSGTTLNVAALTIILNGSGITLNGTLQNSGATLTFGGASQIFSGTGAVAGNLANINIGTTASSNTVFSLSNTLTVNNLRVDRTPNTASTLTLASTAKMSVLNSVDIFRDGALVLKSDATSTASLLAAATGINGGSSSANVELFLSGAPGGLSYHYFASPVMSAPVAIFSSLGILDVLKYRENFITTDNANGWVAYDGWHYNSHTKAWENLGAGEAWSAFVPGTGYNYYYSSDRTYTFSGRLNTANTSVTLAYNTSGSTPVKTQMGYNLIGNPFSCGIDWDAVVAANNIWNDAGTAIYFTRNGRFYTYVNGITVPDDMGDGWEIPAMQGFFIKAEKNNLSLTIPASAKIHTSHARYKSATVSDAPRLRLRAEINGKSDQAVILFNQDATAGFDNMYDSRKLFVTTGSPVLSSLAGTNEMIVNTLPAPADSTEIPLKLVATTAGIYTITATEITGLTGYHVWINDKVTGVSQELTDNRTYSFTTAQGTFTTRFTISFAKTAVTAVPDVRAEDKSLTLWQSSGLLSIRVNGEEWNGIQGDIRVYDLTGRVVMNTANHGFYSGELLQLPFNQPQGVYIVDITSRTRRFTGKIIR